MVRTASTMLSLGTTAPDFSLINTTNGQKVCRDDFRGKSGLLVIFLCNHCPYVKHVASALASLTTEYISQNIGVVGISSNDASAYPDDGPDKMKAEASAQGYQFPYLFDDTQEVARMYQAACTPDFFLFDAEFKLVYRGQMDDTRPKQGSTATGKDLRSALDALLEGKPTVDPQKPSIGCNIKWKSGSEPNYFNPAGIG